MIEKMAITRDQLYEAAFKYKKTGLEMPNAEKGLFAGDNFYGNRFDQLWTY